MAARLGLDLHVDLDRGALRRSLETVLRNAVRSGRCAGTRLPSSRSLAADLGVARGTVSQAYEQLVAEGYLTARQGSGTRVAALTWPDSRAAAPGPRPGVARRDTIWPDPAGRDGDRQDGDEREAGRQDGGWREGDRRQADWDFWPESPDVSSFPRAAWLTATRRVLASCPSAAFNYGNPRGARQLRRALAGYLGRARGVLTSPDQIVVCSGYTHALALLATLLRDGGTRSIGFEDPSLPVHRQVAAGAGLRIQAVPVDEHGIAVGQIRAAAVVVTPAHQYPTGVTLEPARRAQLADWASRPGHLVIEDDYDGEFRFDRQPVGAVQGLAPEHIAYAGTASKTLAPGLRLAWLAVPPRLVDALVERRRDVDRHPSVIDQLVLADMIDSGGYDRHVRQCRIRYRARRDRLVELLAQRAPGVSIRGIAAGLHAMAWLPPGGLPEDEVVSLAGRRGIALEGLAGHWISRGPHPGGLVLGYARPPAHGYEPGLQALAALLGETCTG